MNLKTCRPPLGELESKELTLQTKTISDTPLTENLSVLEEKNEEVNYSPIPQPIKLRGKEAMLPHGGIPEVVSPYMLDLISKTGGRNGPLGIQFLAQSEKERCYDKDMLDPLIEDHHEVAPGLVYKYLGKVDKKGKVLVRGRVLWTITRFCATYCRFCTRGREVGIPAGIKAQTEGTIANQPFLEDAQIDEVFRFLKNHKEINEVILSGGDPFVAPKEYLNKIVNGLAELQRQGYIDMIRIGTRLPVHNPKAFQAGHYELLSKLKNPHLMVHIAHPAEMTEDCLNVLNNFRRISGAIVMSQAVLLKGVNDSVEILYELFMKEAKEGIRPYYLYQNDPVYWAQHFTVPIKKAISLWQKLRPRLSGVAATARFVIDTPYGHGKIPLPEGGAWKVDYSKYMDFRKKKHGLK